MNETMQAGRELDALIAEKVMGWPPKPAHAGWQGDVVPSLADPKWVQAGPDRGWEMVFLPNYSTDIAAAWKVVEKMRETPKPFFSLAWYISGRWGAAFLGHDDGTDAEMADTAPHAICLAALRAVAKAPTAD